MRGEHSVPDTVSFSPPGSPPHARGTPYGYRGGLVFTGITPACAGNTLIDAILHEAIEDHPRMRGEHFWPSTALVLAAGSPPHARGTPPPFRVLPAVSGITPACAGNTCRLHEIHPGSQDHPRMRGEHRFSESR